MCNGGGEPVGAESAVSVRGCLREGFESVIRGEGGKAPNRTKGRKQRKGARAFGFGLGFI